jgi:hypothetical protein
MLDGQGRKEKKRAKAFVNDHKNCDRLTKLYQPYQGENSTLLLALKQHCQTDYLSTDLLGQCGEGLAGLAGIPLPDRDERRRRSFIVGWLNKHADQLLPFIHGIVIEDDTGEIHGFPQEKEQFRSWKEKAPEDYEAALKAKRKRSYRRPG